MQMGLQRLKRIQGKGFEIVARKKEPKTATSRVQSMTQLNGDVTHGGPRVKLERRTKLNLLMEFSQACSPHRRVHQNRGSKVLASDGPPA